MNITHFKDRVRRAFSTSWFPNIHKSNN